MIRFSELFLKAKWSSGEAIRVRNKTYRVGRMSYGDYFLEEKKDWNRPETQEHSANTLWLEKEVIGL